MKVGSFRKLLCASKLGVGNSNCVFSIPSFLMKYSGMAALGMLGSFPSGYCGANMSWIKLWGMSCHANLSLYMILVNCANANLNYYIGQHSIKVENNKLLQVFSSYT